MAFVAEGGVDDTDGFDAGVESGELEADEQAGECAAGSHGEVDDVGAMPAGSGRYGRIAAILAALPSQFEGGGDETERAGGVGSADGNDVRMNSIFGQAPIGKLLGGFGKLGVVGAEVHPGTGGVLHEDILADVVAGLLRREDGDGLESELSAADGGGERVVGADCAISDDALAPFGQRLAEQEFKFTDLISTVDRAAKVVLLHEQVCADGGERTDGGGEDGEFPLWKWVQQCVHGAKR